MLQLHMSLIANCREIKITHNSSCMNFQTFIVIWVCHGEIREALRTITCEYYLLIMCESYFKMRIFIILNYLQIRKNFLSQKSWQFIFPFAKNYKKLLFFTANAKIHSKYILELFSVNFYNFVFAKNFLLQKNQKFAFIFPFCKKAHKITNFFYGCENEFLQFLCQKNSLWMRKYFAKVTL